MLLRPTIQAAVLNAALRAAAAHCAWRLAADTQNPARAEEEPATTMRRALTVAAEGLRCGGPAGPASAEPGAPHTFR